MRFNLSVFDVSSIPYLKTVWRNNMLKKLFTSSFITLAVLAANPVKADVAESLANICAIVKANDKGELRKKMKSVRSEFDLKLRDYYTGSSCGGESLIRVAILNDAVDAGTLLVKKMPKKHLAEPEQDGKTLQAWINENGLKENAVAKVVAERI